MALQSGDTPELIIEKAAAGGEMLARVDGQIVLVSGSIPGERVVARIEKVARHVAHARAIEVRDPSPDRRDAYADPQCGGCLYNHIAYSRQLALKSEIIADAFARIGKIPLPAAVPVTASPEEGYRMRARLHLRGGRLGFFREGTHDVCDARLTRQLLPATCDALDRLTAAIRSLGAAAAIREVELSENIDASERVVHFEATPPLEMRILDALAGIEGFARGPHVTDVLTFGEHRVALRRHVLAFFQGNRHLLAGLVEYVTGQLPTAQSLVDLYAGVGLFAVSAAVLRGSTVVAVEGDRCAAEDLHANAAATGAAIESRRSTVEAFAAAIKPSPDAIVVDPPRTGMTPPALEGVLRAKPRLLIYVSCDVATLARDARAIVGGGYAIQSIRAFDLFPNTPHVETVVGFAR